MQIILINFRKEILPFLSKAATHSSADGTSEDCSDVLVVSDSMAIAAHNEDANVAIVGHTYVITFTLMKGMMRNWLMKMIHKVSVYIIPSLYVVFQLPDQGFSVKWSVLHCLHIRWRASKLCLWL